jgi:putative phage-type endonuclease
MTTTTTDRRRHRVRQVAPAGLEHTDRAAWLELRRAGIGGSDMAAVLGMGEFGRTRWQVWLDKTGALPDEELDEKTAERYRFGHRTELAAADEFRYRYPAVRLARVGMLARADLPWLRVNLDRRVHRCPDGDGPCLLEIKSRSAYTSKQWDPGGDPERVPDAPAIQVQHGLLVTGWRHGHLAVVIGGSEMRDYRIDADPALQKTMLDEGRWFWHHHVLPGVAPPVDASERTGRLLDRLWGADPDSVKEAPAEITGLLAELRAANAEAGEASDRAKALAHRLQAWLGEFETAVDWQGRVLFSWRRNGTFRAGAFREQQPGAYARYSHDVTAADTDRLAAEDPDLYRRYRSRAFRLGTATEGE